tara:strand:+ start:501 stop:1928 length:1428 start_codon:yes stop_codon:yes gene_type:complete
MSKVDQSSAPALLNIRSMPTNTALQFSTDITDPVVFNQDFCRFELQPKGFLHPNSQIVLSVKHDGATRAFPYVNVGLFSLIQRAVLKTSTGRTICSTEDLNQMMGCESMLVSNSANKEREQYKTGRQIAYESVYKVGANSRVSQTDALGYGIANGKEYNEDATHGRGGGVGVHEVGTSVQDALLSANESTFAISLNDLFPYLKSGNQLPLYMMPSVLIELYWQPVATKGTRLSAPKAGANVQWEIKRPQIFADYLFYGGDFMEQYRQKNSNLTFNYVDYRLSKNSQTQAQAVNSVRNIGGNGMVVSKVLCAYEHAHADPHKHLIGVYNAKAPSFALDNQSPPVATKQRQELKANLFVNSRFLYPQTVGNPATHFHHLIGSQGSPAFVSRDHYSGEGGGLSGVNVGKFESKEPSTDLRGTQFWQGHKLLGVDRVDSRGIDLHMAMPLADSVHTQRAWLEVLRYATLVDGEFNCYFA